MEMVWLSRYLANYELLKFSVVLCTAIFSFLEELTSSLICGYTIVNVLFLLNNCGQGTEVTSQ